VPPVPPPSPQQPPWHPAFEYKDRTPNDPLDNDPAQQYYSYWVLIDFLVPNTQSKIEEHTTAEQGVSVFSPIDYDDQSVVAGEKDEEKGEGDGGGVVPLSPWTGGRGGNDNRHVLLSPGTDTAWVWGVPPNAPPGTTEKTWYAQEGQEFVERKDDPNVPYDPSDPRQWLPEDVNRVVEVGDLNGDGINDVVYLTEKGTYVMLTDDSAGSTNRYHPPVLLSNVVDDITDVVTLDYNGDGAQDLVLLTRDETKPNRIYYGDSRDPNMNNLAQDEHVAGVTVDGYYGDIPAGTTGSPVGDPVGGLRYAPLGFDGVTYDANGNPDERDPPLGGVPASSKFKGTKVVGFDTDGDGVDDSFVVVTDQVDGGGVSPQDELYLMGSKTPIKIPDSATPTRDVVALKLNNDPNEPTTLIFAKDGVNKYLQIPTQTQQHLIDGDAAAGVSGLESDKVVRYEDMTTFAEILDSTNLGKMTYPDLTDPSGMAQLTPTGQTTTDWDPAASHDTHSLKVIEVDDHVYINGLAQGTTSRFHIYEGFTPAPDTATPTTSTHSGNYYHNPGTPDLFFSHGIAYTPATPANIVATRTNIDAGTSDPDLQQITELDVMQKEQDKPPVVILLNKEGTKVVLTPYEDVDTPAHKTPVYDGRGSSPTHNPTIGTEMEILDAGGTVREGVTDAQQATDAARDLKASHGLLVVADFDNDGYQDVLSGTHVVLSEDGLFNEGATSTTVPEEHQPKKYWQGPAPLAVTALDVDDDGDVDIVALTHEQEWVVVLNDGTGTFDKLTQQRLPVRDSSNPTDKFVLDTHPAVMADRDETKAPRMIPFNDGVAFAMEQGLGYFSFGAVTDTHVGVAPLGTSLQPGQLVLDMKTARLNGQASANQDDLIFLTADGNVHIVEADGTTHVVAQTVPGTVQRLGVGNVMGDAPRGYERDATGAIKVGTEEGQVDNAGALANVDEVDPRSLDIVVATTTGVYVLPSPKYDPDAPTNGIAALKAETWRLAHTFATPTPRTVTALQVRDMDGNGFADMAMGFLEDPATPAADAIYRSIVYTKATLLQDDGTGTGGTLYERPTAASIEDATKMTFTEKKLSPVADGGGSAQAENDAHSTTQLLVADMKREGNLDVIYTSQANEPARVSYARPPADPAPVAAEKSPAQMEADAYRADVLAGMLAFIDAALAATPPSSLTTPVDGFSQGRVSPHADTDEERYPNSYTASLSNGDTPANAIVADDGAITHQQYQDPEGNLVSAAGARADIAQCRAPAEEVVPMQLSVQIDFPVVVRCAQPLKPNHAHAHTHAAPHSRWRLLRFVRSRARTRPSPTASCSTRSTRAAKSCRRPRATRCPSAASSRARSTASPRKSRPALRRPLRRPRRRRPRRRPRRRRPRRRPRHRRPRRQRIFRSVTMQLRLGRLTKWSTRRRRTTVTWRAEICSVVCPSPTRHCRRRCLLRRQLCLPHRRIYLRRHRCLLLRPSRRLRPPRVKRPVNMRARCRPIRARFSRRSTDATLRAAMRPGVCRFCTKHQRRLHFCLFRPLQWLLTLLLRLCLHLLRPLARHRPRHLRKFRLLHPRPL
jgi:hypothetical protein